MPSLLAAPWLFGFGTTGVASKHPLRWELTWFRIVEFPALLLGGQEWDPLAYGFGLAFLAAVASSISPARWSWHHSSLYVMALFAYFFAPFQLLGVACVYPRFAALAIPGAILNTKRANPLLPVLPRRLLIVGLSVIWMSILIGRAAAFDAQARDFDRAVAKLSECRRLRPLVLDNKSEAFPNLPLYVHFPAYYQAAHGGYYGFSFARFSSVLMVYRSGVDIGMEEDAEWNEVPFDPARELAQYDCVMVRDKRSDIEPAVFGDSAIRARVQLVAHQGQWWIYRTRETLR
jgi:hypothetical protein